MKIMVVEDDPIISAIYDRVLTKAGYEVQIIADGSEAFHAIHQTPFDLLILDIMLPQMDGLAILRRIRMQKRFQQVPILVISSLKTGSIQSQALAAGASRIMAKTDMVPQTLLSAVKELLDTVPPPGLSEDQTSFTVEHVTLSPGLEAVKPDAPKTPALQLKMADAPAPPLPPPPKPPPLPQPSAPIKLADKAQGIKLAESAEEKKGFFGRLFGKHKED